LPRARAVDGAPQVPELAALVRAARKRHPELRAQHAALAQANAERDVAEREAWPTPAIGVSYEHESSPFDPDNDIVLGTIELPLPLFARNQGDRAMADAEAARARAERDAAAQQLEGRIASAHAALQTAASRMMLFAAQIGPRLEESLALLERGFTAGEIPLLEVLAARERLLSAKRAALDAGADYARAHAELEYAIGAELPAAGGSP
jgi:cobalt-zinc-cadmium efflux system outer membrane protein